MPLWQARSSKGGGGSSYGEHGDGELGWSENEGD